MLVRNGPDPTDLVPLADRVRWMRAVRLGAALLIVALWIAQPTLREGTSAELYGVILAYLGISVAADLVWTVAGRRALWIFGGLLIIDGLFITWAIWITGQTDSPVRYIALGYLVSVALLASFRTGLKVTFWFSLCLFVSIYMQEGNVLADRGAPNTDLSDPAFRTELAFVIAAWFTTIGAASFAAVNERELRRRRYDLESLARLSLRLEGTTDSLTVGQALIQSIVDDHGYERVLLFATSGRDLVLVGQHGAQRAGHAIPLGEHRESLVARAAADRRTLLISRFEPEDDERLAYLLPEARNLILVPLHAEGQAVGVLVCEHGVSRGSRVERRVITILERYCSQAGLALDNARLVEQLARTATTDGLTGLANRHSFDQVIGREISRAARTGDHFTVVLLDIDHFKSVNDQHGHLVGDDVLRRLASILDENVRGEDTVARFGGEEFAILMPTLDKSQGIAAAERLRMAAAEGLDDLSITASFGIATLPADGMDAIGLLEAADQALYASKRNGRNRVTAAAGPATSPMLHQAT